MAAVQVDSYVPSDVSESGASPSYVEALLQVTGTNARILKMQIPRGDFHKQLRLRKQCDAHTGPQHDSLPTCF